MNAGHLKYGSTGYTDILCLCFSWKIIEEKLFAQTTGKIAKELSHLNTAA
jgi:hypothetical protein